MYYIGFDVGGMSVKCGIVDENGKILSKRSFATKPERGADALIEEMAHTYRAMIEDEGIAAENIGGIGAGIPGTTNSKTGIVSCAANIYWRNVPFAQEMQKLTGKPASASNDANCAALAEQMFGSGKGYDNAVMVTLGTGVGSGIVIDGKLFEGVDSLGAEVGHMVIIVGGRQCNCGRRGCWEAYASTTALIHMTKKAIENSPITLMRDIAKKEGEVNGKVVFQAAREGDRIALDVLDNYVKYVGEGLCNLANILHPNVFIIGGGISAEGEFLIKPIQHYLDSKCYGGSTSGIEVVQAKLGNNAGIIGAAALCFSKK